MNITRKENETEEQFLWRIGQLKDSGVLDMSWEEIASVMNQEFREDVSEYRSEAAYRKPYQQAKRFFDSGIFNSYDAAYLDRLRDEKQEIRKEKQKLYDERNSLSKMLREQGRAEYMSEIVQRVVETHRSERFEYEPTIVPDSDSDLIIHLTDIHCGITTNTPFNTYNVEVMKHRLNNFLNEIYEIRNTYDAENAYLILGGDLISGLIHVNTRIESKENIVEQIMIVSDAISSFVYELSKMFKKVEVYTTAGNHARATANKEETVRGENFDLLVPFTCKKDLKNIENVEFIDNYLGYDIATFDVRGHRVYATHGDKDTATNVVTHMTNFARKAGLPMPDMCYLGHRHTNGLTTVDDVKVIESGCVDGSDSYCIDKRLIGTPEQTVTVVTERCRVKALCDIQIE